MYMDTNGDGLVNRQELLAYCALNGLEQQHMQSAFDEVAYGMDLRGNRRHTSPLKSKMHSRCMRGDWCQQKLHRSDNTLTNVEGEPDFVDLHDFTECFGEVGG